MFSLKRILESQFLPEAYAKSDLKFKRLKLPIGYFAWFVLGCRSNGFLSQMKIARRSPYSSYFLPAETKTTFQKLPEIEALVVAARKDFRTLPLCLMHIQSGSSNFVQKISVVTPAEDIELCKTIIKNIQGALGVEVSVLNEDEQISAEIRQQLKNKFMNRYGWVLQQLLTVDFVSKSSSAGVLVVDADTVLIKARNWLDTYGRQLLLVSQEFNASYYRFLNKLGLSEISPKYTHVCHHMLIQPKILNFLISEAGLRNTAELAETVILNSEACESPISVDFELYAQGLKKYFNQNALLVEFSNAGIPALDSELEEIVQFEKTKGALHSLSFHSYLNN